MAWIPIDESSIIYDFNPLEGPATMVNSVASYTDDDFSGNAYRLTFEQFDNGSITFNVRVTNLSFSANSGSASHTCTVRDINNTILFTQPNQSPVPGTSFTPSPFTFSVDLTDVDQEITVTLTANTGPGGTLSSAFLFEIEVPDPPSDLATRSTPQLAYELDKGWSFDGNYIPHFVELNWYFGDQPVNYHSIQKIRIHGLTKGRTLLQVSMNGMESDRLWYLADYSQPQTVDLPYTPVFVNPDFEPVSNYVDYAARGVSIQMKFDGRNTDITLPEPSHVIQVLIPQTTPPSTGKRAN